MTPRPIRVLRVIARLNVGGPALHVTYLARGLAERGYDPIYGARPLRRLMQNEIDDRLATAILNGTIRDGNTVRVDLDPATDALTVGSVAVPV